jgi:selenophosphate synthetase-related protein
MFLENTKEFITMVKTNEVEKVITILERANREFNYLGDIVNDNSYPDFKDKYLVH